MTPKRFRGPGSAEDAEEGWPRGRAAEAPAPFPETPKRFHPAEVGNTGATAKRFSGRSGAHGTSGESRRRGTQGPSVACSLARQSAAQKAFRRRSGRGQPRRVNVSMPRKVESRQRHRNVSTRGKLCPTVLCGGHSTQRCNFSSRPQRRRNVLVPSINDFMAETPKRFGAGRAVYHASGPLCH